MKINIKAILLSFVIVYLVAFIGSLFTSPNTDTSWYEQIKPEITSPSIVFPIVWSVLFFMIAISFYLVFISNKKNKNKFYIVFTLNLLLNIFWSVLYFGIRRPDLAFIEVIPFWISILLMIKYSYKINFWSAILLIPYLVWVGFTSVLNYITLI